MSMGVETFRAAGERIAAEGHVVSPLMSGKRNPKLEDSTCPSRKPFPPITRLPLTGKRI
jgi:hypothetical protein